MTQAGHEAEEVKDVVWTYAGWVVIILICIGAGVFLGYTMWGNAASLKRDLDQTTEMVGTLKNERERSARPHLRRAGQESPSFLACSAS